MSDELKAAERRKSMLLTAQAVKLLHRDDEHETAEMASTKAAVKLAEFVLADLAARETEPQWMRRPSGPGKWVCMSDQNGRDIGFHSTVLDLDADKIKRGAPFYAECVYGPIPSPPQEPQP